MMVFARQLRLELKLQLRYRLGLAYGFLFPSIFLLAFWVLYRHESPPLVRHLGELLTVTALAGACFGFPLALVSERERGVWRRYRLLPVATTRLLASALIARYLLLCAAALLQVGLAIVLGMPAPRHPVGLWAAFTLVSFAFLGLGLLIAMVADTATAAQALGQSLFLPMLILGGVAVRLETMPEWVHHLSAFLPGRYAVGLIDQGADGALTTTDWFSAASLALMGGAAFLAGAKLFRSDTKQRVRSRDELRWIGAALAGWLMVGVGAELGGHVSPARERVAEAAVATPAFVRSEQPVGVQVASERPPAEGQPAPTVDSLLAPSAEVRNATPDSSRPAVASIAAPAPDSSSESSSAPWRAVTPTDIDRDLMFDRLPPDAGLVAPIARATDRDDPFVADRLDCIASMLPDWKPAAVADPVQRVRNLLYVAAVPDVLQMQEIESVVPLVVFERLEQELPAEELVQILYWIALHPHEGDLSATGRLLGACLDVAAPADVEMLRSRTGVYAAKLLGRLTGKLTPR